MCANIIGKHNQGEDMRLLKLAVEIQRWDLAAHTIILATARILSNGDRPHVSRRKEKKGSPKGQSKR